MEKRGLSEVNHPSNPVPEFIVKNNLRTLGLTRKDFIEWLKLSHTKN